MTQLSDQQIAQFAYNAGFRNTPQSNDLTLAVAVALAESEGNTVATNKNTDSFRSVDLGVWQINNHWHADLIAKGNWSDPAYNATMAYIIKTQRGGWSQWSTFKHGTYFKFMTRAAIAAGKVSPGTTPSVSPTVPDMGGNSSGDTSGLQALTNPHNYLRLAMISTGGTLILVSLVLLGWNNAPTAAKKLAKAAVLKKVPLK